MVGSQPATVNGHHVLSQEAGDPTRPSVQPLEG